METEDFLALWKRRDFRQGVVQLVRCRSSDPETRADLLQEAAIVISDADPQKTDEWYFQLADRHMAALMMREYRRTHPDADCPTSSRLVSVRISNDLSLTLNVLQARRGWDRSEALRRMIEAGGATLLEECAT